ncbi:MAG: endonuclease [Candidatus Cloacimonadota bacterium]|nr:MAG: endonuclease [Candidatus Cloacimonadota bacterium]PIE78187.1 MAG: endonuclease [Candidatus Delongbacteria bacterium]
MSKVLINTLFENLSNFYEDFKCGGKSWWPADSEFEVMVGAILTQNTNWSNVEKAIINLKKEKLLTPKSILKVEENYLSEIIRPSGFYNQKSKRLKSISLWFGLYEFEVEKVKRVDTLNLRNELLSISGVGPETADSILVYAFGKPSFVIDSYTRRIMSRFGVDVPKKYDDFKTMVEVCIPKDLNIYDYYHGLIVEHAKNFCRKKPLCEICPIGGVCKKIV